VGRKRVMADKDRRVPRFYVRKIPAASPHLRQLFEEKPAGNVMGDASARNLQAESVTHTNKEFAITL